MDSLLPISALTTPRDRFHCAPYRADISVTTCHARRGATYAGGRMRRHAPKQHAAFPECSDCPLGAEVARQVPPVPAAAAATQPCDVCGVPVTSAKKRRPLCPAHRANPMAVTHG